MDELWNRNATWDRKYVYNGRTAHLVNDKGASMCQSIRLSAVWFGTGSQEEREKAEALPVCRICLRRKEEIEETLQMQYRANKFREAADGEPRSQAYHDELHAAADILTRVPPKWRSINITRWIERLEKRIGGI